MQNTVKEELNLHWSEFCCCKKQNKTKNKLKDLILLSILQNQTKKKARHWGNERKAAKNMYNFTGGKSYLL